MDCKEIRNNHDTSLSILHVTCIQKWKECLFKDRCWCSTIHFLFNWFGEDYASLTLVVQLFNINMVVNGCNPTTQSSICIPSFCIMYKTYHSFRLCSERNNFSFDLGYIINTFWFTRIELLDDKLKDIEIHQPFSTHRDDIAIQIVMLYIRHDMPQGLGEIHFLSVIKSWRQYWNLERSNASDRSR